MRNHASDPKPDRTLLTLPEQLCQTERVSRLRRELEEVIIKVNYHFSSGYERHVNLQTPESIFLNFLKKFIKEIPHQYSYRICKKDFNLVMTDDKQYVILLSFHDYSDKHDWRNLDKELGLLSKAAMLIDFEELKAKSHTLDKYYQQTERSINAIRDFSFK